MSRHLSSSHSTLRRSAGRSPYRSLNDRYRMRAAGTQVGHRPARRSGSGSTVPLVAFLLVVSFGILMTTGCSQQNSVIKGPGDLATEQGKDVTFTEQDAARFRALSTGSGSSSPADGTESPHLLVNAGSSSSSSSEGPPILDLSQVKLFHTIRSGPGATGSNLYRVINAFANFRSAPNIRAKLIGRLEKGALVRTEEFVNAEWAKVEAADGTKGFIAAKYIAKLTAQEKLADEKKAFQGIYYVNFRFVNVRKSPDPKSDKIGEIPGLTFVRPTKIQGDWATVSFQGKDGHVSMKFLAPFLPRFLVRQEEFSIPILHFHVQEPSDLAALKDSLALLKQKGGKLVTLADFADFLIQQEQGAARLDPASVIVAISGVNPDNVRRVSDAISEAGVHATVFIETRFIGISGITEKMLLNLIGNGADVESAGHSGDDLRSLTNAQVTLELGQSRKILEELTHTTVRVIGYPQGGVNERVLPMAADAGYLLGVSSGGRKSFVRDQLLRLPAFDITASMKAEETVKIVQ